MAAERARVPGFSEPGGRQEQGGPGGRGRGGAGREAGSPGAGARARRRPLVLATPTARTRVSCRPYRSGAEVCGAGRSGRRDQGGVGGGASSAPRLLPLPSQEGTGPGK